MINNQTRYNVEIDNITKGFWEDSLLKFDDATIRQTWSFGKKNLSHLVLKYGEEIVAMAQVDIKKLPILKIGIANIFWGPLWRRKGNTIDYNIFDNIIKELKNEYVVKRGLLLRIWPFAIKQPEGEILHIMGKHGFLRNSTDKPYQTIMLNILPSMEMLRKNLAQKWRNQLNVAERHNLAVVHGQSDVLFDEFYSMLTEMLLRKKFEVNVNYDMYHKIQNDLPESLKMQIFVCKSENIPVAAGVFSAIGDTGEYLLGATANNGLKFNGANLVQWEAIKWMKEKGCTWYDLGGIDPKENPGVYRFKSGVAGKSGLNAVYLGQFYLANKSLGYILYRFMNMFNPIRKRLQKILKSFSQRMP